MVFILALLNFLRALCDHLFLVYYDIHWDPRHLPRLGHVQQPDSMEAPARSGDLRETGELLAIVEKIEASIGSEKVILFYQFREMLRLIELSLTVRQHDFEVT